MQPCGQGRLGDEHGLGGPAHVAAAGNLEEAFHLRQQHPLAIDVFYRRVNTIGTRPMATRPCRAAPYSQPPTSAAPRPRFRWRGELSNRPVPQRQARGRFLVCPEHLFLPPPYGKRASSRKGSNNRLTPCH